jgi:hypothetical protein
MVMNENNTFPRTKSIRCAYEIALCLNVSFAVVSIVALESLRPMIPFFRLEIAANRVLHIRQTDFISGYIAYAAASLLLAFIALVGLRLSAGLSGTKLILRSVAGPVIVLLPAAFWIIVYQNSGWPFRWPYRGAPFELVSVLIGALFYASGRWHLAPWFSISLLAGHFAYWFWMPPARTFASDYSGPIAPLLGFCSGVAWVLYVESSEAPSNELTRATGT